mgnify:CR=1 FL=1
MAIRLGDDAPNFTAPTTQGEIDFYDWKGDSWAVLFSHPKDFTPVCTTELGYTAKLKDEFDKRGVKVLALSVDPVEDHRAWSKDIEETQGIAPNFPIIADSDRKVADLYGAQKTPEVYVLGPKGTLLYRGRIDETHDDPKNVKSPDLRNALEAILSGKPVPAAETKAFGCSIKRV